jgi:hypothetical protein
MHSVTISAGVSVFFIWHYFCSCDKHNGKTKYMGITAWWAMGIRLLPLHEKINNFHKNASILKVKVKFVL